MPIGGRLTDKMGPGKIVLGGIVVIAAGMGVFTQIGADSSYLLLLGALFVMGMGMGLTMMPIMSAAMSSLTDGQIARGSTMMNIVQQTAGSIGTAVMSVVLTNQLLDRGLDSQTVAMQHVPEVAAQEPPGMVDQVLSQAADAFGNTCLVAAVLIALTFIPAFLLPRKKSVNPHLEAEGAPTVMMH